MKIKKKTILIIIGWVISIILLSSLFMKMDFKTLYTSLCKTNWLWLILAVFTNFFVIGLKSYRWQLIMEPEKEKGRKRLASYSMVLKATLLGFAGNNLLPARGGDWFKIYILGKWANVSKTSLASVTLLDKLFDGMSIIALFGFFSLTTFITGGQAFPAWVKTGSIISSLAIVIILIICFLLFRYHINGEKKIGRLANFTNKLGAGMSILSKKHIITGTLFLSVSSSLLQIITLMLCQKAFHIEYSLLVPCVIFIAINLAIIIPSAPSGIGPFEAAAVLAYAWVGLKTETAFNITLMYHAVQVLPVTFAGLYLYFKSGMRFYSPTTNGQKASF